MGTVCLKEYNSTYLRIVIGKYVGDRLFVRQSNTTVEELGRIRDQRRMMTMRLMMWKRKTKAQ